MSTQILVPANYREQKPVELHTPVIPNQDWFAQGPVDVTKKNRPDIGVFEMLCPAAKNPPGREKTQRLDDTYIFENREEVTRFIQEHHLQNLLVQAKEHLKERFGATSIKTLSLICDDEGFESLFCVISAAGSLQENLNALRAFDRNWWLSQVHNAAGRLNFDFQIL
jgi:hypothetical protein